MSCTVENSRNKDVFDAGSHFCSWFFTSKNLLQGNRDFRLGKLADIRDDESGGRFNPFHDFEDGAALGRYRARNVGSFWFQRLVFAFVSNNRFERSCDDEFSLQFRVFEKKLQSILISSDIRFFKPNADSQRKMAFWTTGDLDREASKILIRNVTEMRKHRW